MHKIIIFDLDGTLAPLGKGMKTKNIEKIKQLEEAGYQIVVNSGKPTYYLCGFMRQIGLNNPILIGENGAVIQYGIDLPPVKYLVHPYSEKAKSQISNMKNLIDQACPDSIWYQPNEVGLTPFPSNEDGFNMIQHLIDCNQDDLTELDVYRHSDCFDFTPKNISKRSGLELLSRMEGLTSEDYIVVGDGVNDIPMFEYGDVSIRVGQNCDYNADYTFESIDEALTFILDKGL